MQNIIDFAQSLAEFFVFTILIKYVITKWIAQQFVSFFARLFVKTEREEAIWKHYQDKALRNGHKKKTPIKCDEGLCVLL